MNRILKLWKVILFDTIGVVLMITALLIGWLPGPGGIPLFLVGLGFLAVHHDWAEELIDKVKDLAENMGDKIFRDNKKIQKNYDIFAPILLLVGIAVLVLQAATWQISIGIFLCVMSVTIFFGNRKRYKNVKFPFKHKN